MPFILANLSGLDARITLVYALISRFSGVRLGEIGETAGVLSGES